MHFKFELLLSIFCCLQYAAVLPCKLAKYFVLKIDFNSFLIVLNVFSLRYKVDISGSKKFMFMYKFSLKMARKCLLDVLFLKSLLS